MLCGDEDMGGVVDADGVVGRRVHDQQRLVQFGHLRRQVVLGDVVEEFALDVERAAGQRDFDLALLADVLDAILEQMRDMRGIGGRGDGHDRFCLGDLPGGGQNRGAAKAVADQDRRRLAGLPQMIGGANEIGDVGGEGRVGEIAFAGAEPGEVEPQHRDPLAASAVAMRLAASTSLPQVKQCANSA